MIPFAGYDPHENVPRKTKAIQAYEFFELGWDTMRIAARLNISEAKALKLVTQERSRLLRKPNPYEVQS